MNRATGWGKYKNKSHRCIPEFSAVPEDAIAVNSRTATPTGYTRYAETAIKPGQVAHIETEPRVKGREVVQRMAVFYNQSLLVEEICNPGTYPSYSPMALQ